MESDRRQWIIFSIPITVLDAGLEVVPSGPVKKNSRVVPDATERCCNGLDKCVRIRLLIKYSLFCIVLAA